MYGLDMDLNKPQPFNPALLKVSLSLRQLEEISKRLTEEGSISGLNKITWALKALQLLDLTTLGGDDTASNVRRMCYKAAYPFPDCAIATELDRDLRENLHTAAVCVYPARVHDAYSVLDSLNKEEQIGLAAVATGFPTGQYGIQSRLQEINYALIHGATEIDVVINRQMALVGDWEGLYNEITLMRKACLNRAYLKTILAVGELGTVENIYKASMACMMAGADFIKTSTGKETVNASLPLGLAMIYAIKEFRRRTCQLVGFKPAGGIKTVNEAFSWMKMVKETLGSYWLRPRMFRFGGSKLLEEIIKVVIKELATGGDLPVVEEVSEVSIREPRIGCIT